MLQYSADQTRRGWHLCKAETGYAGYARERAEGVAANELLLRLVMQK